MLKLHRHFLGSLGHCLPNDLVSYTPPKTKASDIKIHPITEFLRGGTSFQYYNPKLVKKLAKMTSSRGFTRETEAMMEDSFFLALEVKL